MVSAVQKNLRPFAPRWAASCRQAALLLLLAAAGTAAVWAAREDRLPLAADRDFYELELPASLVDIPLALTLFDEGDRLFIDTRSDRTDPPVTIPGAFLIRAATFDDDLYELADTVYPEDPLILFGNGDLRRVAYVADLLLARGFEDILIMRGSLAAWLDQGGELSPDPEYFPTVPKEES